jgi:hypothetical protein
MEGKGKKCCVINKYRGEKKCSFVGGGVSLSENNKNYLKPL